MSDKDFKATSLQAMDIDLKITLQGSTLKIELPLSPTGRPNEMPFAAVDQQKKEDYLTKAENRLTDYLASQGYNNFRVDKLTGSGKTEAGAGGVKLELQSGAEANRIFSDKNFLGNLQKSFDQDRGKEYMKAAAAWTEGIGGAGGARVPYNGAVVKVEDTVAFDYYKKNFDRTPGYTFNSEKNEQLNSLNDKMFLRHGFGRRSSSDDAGLPAIASVNDVPIASAMPKTNDANSLEFKNNPTVQQVSAAMERNGIAPDNQNPSLVAGLAGASANLPKVQDVVLTPQTAFALDRDKSDPAANRVQVGMDIANKPFDEVWKTASVALQQTQTPAVVALAQSENLEQKPRTM